MLESVILSFILLIQSPRGREISLVFYPLAALVMMMHLIIAIDLLKDVGRKWRFNAAKRYYSPQIIKLSYDKKDITNFNDLLNQ